MKRYNMWTILYPVVFYYVISGFVFFALNILLGEAQEIYMLKQLISSSATIPFLASLWKQDRYVEKVVYGKEKMELGKLVLQTALTIVSAGALGIALNNFIAMTPLVQASVGFQTANANFFAGGVWLEILASCVVVPIAEELLFRGIILKRASEMGGVHVGVWFSSLLFGVIHMNLVQFIYAVLLGVLLALVVVKTRRVWLAVVGHASANLIAILRAETGFLDFSYELNLVGIGFTLMMAAFGMLATWMLFKQCKKDS